ncbi:hypothetical protein CRV08_04970 [Halarcobacter ebronensis]|uniref:Restriction system protein Mrr-like N-terminal domain-containing protein n=1 Tax=Halarcobacter ebronensis TaxID=1462615 RepID=A0A4V1LRT9_9BACT|nr:hypothetical protein [Halarcobacter ebronensis]RXJ69358.1 hypothetical protein CRV08_04970 [Halarcobacter ebronensis]
MATKNDLQDWVFNALKALDGKGTIVQVAKHIWENHSDDLKSSGDLFYTWQYDIRWAATELRKTNKILPAEKSPKGQWALR